MLDQEVGATGMQSNNTEGAWVPCFHKAPKLPGGCSPLESLYDREINDCLKTVLFIFFVVFFPADCNKTRQKKKKFQWLVLVPLLGIFKFS